MKNKFLAFCLLPALLLSCVGCGGHKHIFDERVTEEAYLKSAASCEASAYYYHSCLCGEKGSTVFKHGSALGHSYGEDGICTVCGDFEDDGLIFLLDKETNTYTVAKYEGGGTDVVIPATYLGLPVTAVSTSAFWNCAELESISFPASVETIPVSAFYRATALKRITVAEGNPVYFAAGNCLVERESGRLVLGCAESAIPSDGVTVIGSAAFKATGIQNIIIPEGVVHIEDDAFAACLMLTWTVLPSTLTAVDRWAFDNCATLTAVYFGGTPEQWESIAMGTENSSLTKASRYYYSETEPTEEGSYWHFVDGVPTPW